MINYYKNLTMNSDLKKTLALNSIRNCILENHLAVLCEPGLFQCFPNAVWHMGVDYHTLDDELENDLREALGKVKLSIDDNIHQTLDVSAEAVYNDWKTILKL